MIDLSVDQIVYAGTDNNTGQAFRGQLFIVSRFERCPHGNCPLRSGKLEDCQSTRVCIKPFESTRIHLASNWISHNEYNSCASTVHPLTDLTRLVGD